MNVRHPGPSVGGNTDLQPKLIDLLLQAPSRRLVPERVAAASGGSSSNFLFGGVHPETGRYYTNYHFDGHGHRRHARTRTATTAEITRHSNCRNTPVEVFEDRYPLLTLEYGLAPDSGGAGRHRGGLSTTRTLHVVADEITLQRLFDRARSRRGASSGGHRAGSARAAGEARRRRRVPRASSRPSASSRRRSSPTCCCTRGDERALRDAGRRRLRRPRRARSRAVREDVREGYVTPEAAARDYGLGGMAPEPPTGTGASRRSSSTPSPQTPASLRPADPARRWVFASGASTWPARLRPRMRDAVYRLPEAAHGRSGQHEDHRRRGASTCASRSLEQRDRRRQPGRPDRSRPYRRGHRRGRRSRLASIRGQGGHRAAPAHKIAKGLRRRCWSARTRSTSAASGSGCTAARSTSAAAESRCTRSAVIDIALWDIAGLAAGQPIHALLGGARESASRPMRAR